MTLAAKLVKVMAAIDKIDKSGHNDAQGYDYLEATEVNRVVRNELVKLNVLFLPDLEYINTRVIERPNKSPLILVDIQGRGRFIDGDDGAELSFGVVGAGGDFGGDKGVYKAITGLTKAAMRSAFLIPDKSDPEVPVVEPDVLSVAEAQPVAQADPAAMATDTQRRHLRASVREAFARVRNIDESMPDAQYNAAFKAYVTLTTGKTSSKDLTVADYNRALARLAEDEWVAEFAEATYPEPEA
jgi:hypothetical protein